MLNSLHIKSLAIIDSIDIDFSKGLTVLTGETGAGKSLIIDAIGLLMGDKTNSSLVRNGENKAVIEGTFFELSTRLQNILKSYDIDFDDDTLILRREIYANGKSIFKANGVSITLSQAIEISEDLIDIHVQNDTLRLFNPKNYLSFIDDQQSNDLLNQYLELRNIYLKSLKEYKELVSKKKELEQNRDYIEFQYHEITEASLKVGEDEDLEEELKYLNNYENIFSSLNGIKDIINNTNVSENLYDLLDLIKKLSKIDEKYNDEYSNVENAYYSISDLEKTVSKSLSNLEFDEDRLNEINIRLSEIDHLKKKYHRNIQELIDYSLDLKKQLELSENSTVYIEDALNDVKKSFNEVLNVGKLLSDLRKTNAKKLSESILTTLDELLLEKVRMNIIVDSVYSNDIFNSSIFSKDGLDKVDILISFNPGEDLKPLSKVASGGEMSRVMMALKCHLFLNKKLSTIIFDEIDTGMSGIVAEKVAWKMKQLSNNMQVFAITHLPIVAAKANQQLFVSKVFENNTTKTKICELSFDERVEVIAKMISPQDNSGNAQKLSKMMIIE